MFTIVEAWGFILFGVFDRPDIKNCSRIFIIFGKIEVLPTNSRALFYFGMRGTEILFFGIYLSVVYF